MRGAFQEDLLVHYLTELRALRETGAGFAAAYPKVAARLQVSGQESPDPHVERLLESFAFLAARVQRNVEAEFPIIPSALLEILYPHLLAPIPSCAVARFIPDPTQGELTTGFVIPRHTPLYADTEEGESCRMRTGYETVLWPLAVAAVAVEPLDMHPGLSPDRGLSLLRVRLNAVGEAPLQALPLDRLRLYINAEPVTASRLYELLMGQCREVVARDEEGRLRSLGSDAVHAVGFADEDAILPHAPSGHPGYRLIQEYFAFPEKYHFIDITGLRGQLSGRSADLLFLLGTVPRDLPALGRDVLLPGCAPVVNLYPRTSEPVRIDETQFDYLLVGDAQREATTEIHTLMKVSASTDIRNATQEVAPFFSFRHRGFSEPSRAYYVARRVRTERPGLSGTDIKIRFVDLDFSPSRPAETTLFAHALCTNRGLAEQVPPGARLESDEPLPVSAVVCLRRPTPQVTPPVGGSALWRLVSHLSLNHLSLSSDPRSLEALQEILRLYAVPGLHGVEAQINGIRAMSVREETRRIGTDAWRGFCRGRAIDLTFDETDYVGASAFMLGAVLSRFLALYASVNSFTRLTVRSLQRDGEWKAWPCMAGDQELL